MERMFTKFISVALLLGIAYNAFTINGIVSQGTKFNLRPQSWNKVRPISNNDIEKRPNTQPETKINGQKQPKFLYTEKEHSNQSTSKLCKQTLKEKIQN